jgi:hypothetical protein
VAQYLACLGITDLNLTAQCFIQKAIQNVVSLVGDGPEVFHPPLHILVRLALCLGVGQLALDGQQLALQLVTVGVDSTHAGYGLHERVGSLVSHPAHHTVKKRLSHGLPAMDLKL